MKERHNKEANGIFGYEGAFYTYTGKLFDLMAVSVLWILGSLPIVTIGAAGSALYAAVSRSVRRDTGTVAARFWKSYRQNLKDSLPLCMGFGAAICLLLLNIGIIMHNMEGLGGLFLVMFYTFLVLLLVVAACYAFAALSSFDMPAGWIIKLSFYLLIRHLPVSFLLLLLFAGAYLLILGNITLALIVPGAATLIASYLLDPILERHMPKEEDEAGGGRRADDGVERS